MLLSILIISESNLTVDQLAPFKDLVAEYSNVFALDLSELGLIDLVSHTIIIGGKFPHAEASQMKSICIM